MKGVPRVVFRKRWIEVIAERHGVSFPFSVYPARAIFVVVHVCPCTPSESCELSLAYII
jgi:hypothetical protein